VFHQYENEPIDTESFWLRTYWRELSAAKTDAKALAAAVIARNASPEHKKLVEDAMKQLSSGADKGARATQLLRIALSFRDRSKSVAEHTSSEEMPQRQEVTVQPGSIWNWVLPWSKHHPAEDAVTRELDLASKKAWSHYRHILRGETWLRCLEGTLLPFTPRFGELGSACILLEDVNRVLMMRLGVVAGQAAADTARLQGDKNAAEQAAREHLGRIKSQVDGYNCFRCYKGCPSQRYLSGEDLAAHVRLLLAGSLPASMAGELKTLTDRIESQGSSPVRSFWDSVRV